jgi:hypothetical protein
MVDLLAGRQLLAAALCRLLLLFVLLNLLPQVRLQYTTWLAQCFESGSVLDPDSIRSVDPDPYSYSDPDPGGQKGPTKTEKSKEFHVFKCWMFSFESFYLDVLCGGLGIGKLDPYQINTNPKH